MRPNRKGLTLLEFILAILIMSGGVVLIMRYAPTMLELSSGMDQLTTSTFLAIQKMEDLRGKVLQDFDKNYAEDPAPFPAPYGDYQYSIETSEKKDMKEIAVHVWHIENSGRRFSLHTQIARR